ncbi:hypothetical protein [Streptomyces microflavus]|uniref:hypothetical protein n=1 Tax=Streptomyces microflavus TaxID=1919 RepID=UPI0036624E17
MTAVPVALDPSRSVLIVRTRPTGLYFGDLPAGAFESAARPVLAQDVRAGDLIVASFNSFPTPGRMTRSSMWMSQPYVAEPGPWNPACPCDLCETERQCFEPNPRVRLGAVPADPRWHTGPGCDVWWADEPLLVIPAALLLIPATASA